MAKKKTRKSVPGKRAPTGKKAPLKKRTAKPAATSGRTRPAPKKPAVRKTRATPPQEPAAVAPAARRFCVYYDFQNVYDVFPSDVPLAGNTGYRAVLDFIDRHVQPAGTCSKTLYLKNGKYPNQKELIAFHESRGYRTAFGPFCKDIDTTMAADLQDAGSRDAFDVCVVVTGDSDFMAPLHMVKKRGKEIHVLSMPGTYRSDGLKSVADVFATLPEVCRRCGGRGHTQTGCGKCRGTGHYIAPCSACRRRGHRQAWCSSCKGSGKTAHACCPACEGFGFGHVEPCATCGGTGSKQGTPCVDCKGAGRRALPCAKCSGTGVFPNEICPACKGQGHLVPEACPRCQGRGGVDKGECWNCKGKGYTQVACTHCRGTGIRIQTAP